MERRKFTQEFKLEAVRVIRDRGISFAQTSEDRGVHGSPVNVSLSKLMRWSLGGVHNLTHI